MKSFFSFLFAFLLTFPVMADGFIPEPGEEVPGTPIVPEIKDPSESTTFITVPQVVVNEVQDPSTSTYPVCDTCKGKIPPGRNYILLGDGRKFCSQQCFQAGLPKCCVCGTHFQKGFKKTNHLFCSKACLAATWPKCTCCGIRTRVWKILPETEEAFCPSCMTLPICFSCGRPDGKAKNLRDGRHLCRVCQKTAIVANQEAAKIVAEVRDLMHEKLGISVDTKNATVGLCGFRELLKTAKLAYAMGEPGACIVRSHAPEEQFGDAQPIIKEDTYEIVMLNYLSRAKMVEVAAHQLATLWIEMNYPKIGDLSVREGFPEWVASEVNKLYNRPEMNIRMKNNPDPYYGDGYRLVKGRIEKLGFEEFKLLLESLSAAQDRP